MEALKDILDFFLHFDRHLQTIIQACGVWTYAVLFAIIFCETGLVVTPFLPGDSLLFAAGAIAARMPQALNIVALLVVLSVAAILGDTVNYALGRWIGPRAFSGKIWFLKQEHLVKTQLFYDRYGAKTIILARFVPIVRTFAPFVAGVGKMNYSQFIFYNIVGGIVWVLVCTMFGYYFGSFEIIKNNFELVVLGIVGVSVLPMAWELWAARRHNKTIAEVPLPPVAHVASKEAE
ncbi:MAG: DedA family protein [Planctomycetaceae bacterium]|nr:DedA family protein [Planctomycetaceae bacterium]